MNKEHFCQYCNRSLIGSKTGFGKHIAKCEKKLARKIRRQRCK